MSKNMFGCRFLDRRRKAEERIARRGDVSKTGRRSVRGDPSFSETNEIGMEGISYIKDLRRSVGVKQRADVERENRKL